jgi:hypothetical protein
MRAIGSALGLVAALSAGCHGSSAGGGGGDGAAAGADAGVSAQGDAVGRAVQGAIDGGKFTTETLTDDKGAPQPMLRVDSLRLSISASCLGADKKLSCAAFDGVKAIVDKKVAPGPGSPAAHTCKAVGAANATWSDARGQSGVCVFADGSAVTDWSLVYTPKLALGT